MSKRKFNESEDNASTSKDINENYSKKSRLSYNFWRENKIEKNNSENEINENKIRNLRIGKLYVILVKYVLNTKQLK